MASPPRAAERPLSAAHVAGGGIRVLPDISAAIGAGGPVVALESSVLAQGLPIPANREAAERMMDAVRRGGAMPAVTAVVRGRATLGLEAAELERFLSRDGVRKVSARDLAVAMAQLADGATTVAASLCIAGATGVDVFATGGIGGVHRGVSFDESADLMELARTPLVVVCAGAKSILDLPATLERLETLGVAVIGYRTDDLPGFFTRSTGLRLGARADTPEEVAAIHLASRSLGRPQATLVVQAPPDDVALPRELVDTAVAEALAEAERDGIRGAATTPFLLGAVLRATEGRSLSTNLGLLEENAFLAARIAVALSRPGHADGAGDGH
ncbi:MAG: pseudouridine-5'-phosphate glycosidase [bacterium]